MAAGEGFEPSHTESESAVLPLHKPAISCPPQRTDIIIQKSGKLSIAFLKLFKKVLGAVSAPKTSANRAPYWVKCSWLKM